MVSEACTDKQAVGTGFETRLTVHVLLGRCQRLQAPRLHAGRVHARVRAPQQWSGSTGVAV